MKGEQSKGNIANTNNVFKLAPLLFQGVGVSYLFIIAPFQEVSQLPTSYFL